VSWTMRLRLGQIVCVLVLLECIRLSRSLRHEWNGTITPVHWLLIVGGVWSGILGFTVQRRIVNKVKKSSSTSTPFTRWRAGHIARLWTATAVGLYGFCLSIFAGPPLAVNALFGLGLLLLLVWMPGQVPGQAG
jgi:hypothetical protein